MDVQVSILDRQFSAEVIVLTFRNIYPPPSYKGIVCYFIKHAYSLSSLLFSASFVSFVFPDSYLACPHCLS